VLSGQGLLDALRRLRAAAARTVPVPGRARLARRSWVGDGRAHIEVRGLRREGTESIARQLEAALGRLHGVHWAQVNAVLGRVVVAFAADEVRLDQLIEVIEAIETAHGLDHERFPNDRPEHPADIEPLHRQLVSLAADAVGIGLPAFVTRMRGRTVPTYLSSALSIVDVTPALRRQLDRRLGPAAADLLLVTGNAIAQGMSEGSFGLLVDAVHRGCLVGEITARRAVWQRREPELYGGGPGPAIPPVPPVARPVPMPPGPVERYADRASLAAVATAAATAMVSRNQRQAQKVLAAATPKAARLSREAFAAWLGRALAQRGVIPLDPAVLRRLDRIDTVVVDAEAVVTGRFQIEAAYEPDGELSAEDARELRARAASLLDPNDPDQIRRAAGWTLGPLHRLAPQRARALARRLPCPGGVRLALLHGKRLVAVLAALPELDPLAADLITAARSVGRLVVAGIGSGLAERLGVDATAPRGSRLAGALRDLQRQGAVVALVALGGAAALSAADCGIGVLSPSQRPPWEAHLMCGPGLAQACRILNGVVAARTVSRQGALVALYGSVAAGILAIGGGTTGAARARLAVNAAAAAGMTMGAWSSRTVGGRPDPLPVDDTPWHSLDTSAALRRLRSSPSGLTGEDADSRHALRSALQQPGPAGLVDTTVGELANPLTPVLAGGAALAAAGGAIVDAALISSVMAANALLGAVQRMSVERTLRRLIVDGATRVRVQRDGAETEVSGDEVVPGDVIALSAGDAVPADCRILRAVSVEVDESSLTGESLPVPKTAGPTLAADVAQRSSILYEGTAIAAGEAAGVVVATGPDTELGRSARLAVHGPLRGVQDRLRRLAGATIPIALAAGGALIAVDLARGRPLRESLGGGIGLAVAAVPEGLPLVATMGQIAAARRMSLRGALVRDHATVEALGRVDVLCFDKTGTLTEGRMALQRISDGVTDARLADAPASLRDVLAAALRACPAETGNGRPRHHTDRAVTTAAAAAGIRADHGAGGWQVIDEVPFHSVRSVHSALGTTAQGHLLSVKGAPERLLPVCARWRQGERLVPMCPDALAQLETEVDRLAQQGYRVLAVAQRQTLACSRIDDELVTDLEFLGLLALADPVRAEAAGAVARLRRAGARVVMMTGDHPSTAGSVAAELHLPIVGPVVTGAELDLMGDPELADLLARASVFARVSPAQKARLVGALQAAQHTVAMTGDGANDAAAIRLADVGITLGKRGTDAAREAADLIVNDDRIETVIDAVVEARSTWASVRDAVSVLLGGNLGEIGFTLGAGLLSSTGSPLNARQLLLVNLLTDLLPSLALAVRPRAIRNPEALLHEGPDQSLATALTRDTLIRAGSTAASTGGAWLVARTTGGRQRAGTVALATLVATQLGQTMATGWRSPLVLGAGVVSAGALGAVIQTPGLSHFFGCRPLGPIDWATVLTASALGTTASAVVAR
jgi:cation-transporting ATPase I